MGTRRQAPSAPLCLDGVLNTQTVCCWLRTTVLLDGCLERVPTAGKPKPGSHTPKRVSVMCCHQAFKGVSTSGRPFLGTLLMVCTHSVLLSAVKQ